jgi:hypothetical protein
MKKKWNISLLVLFVLVACSLLGIIAVQYTRHMAIQTHQMYSYYKSYYLAKGGSEIGLSILQLRWAGYSWEIEKDDPFVTQNIHTGNAFSLKIQGSSSLLSQWYPNEETCLEPLYIGSGESFILPLFIDEPENNITDHFSDKKFYKNKSDLLKLLQIKENQTTNNVNIGVIVSQNGQLNELGILFTTGIFAWDDFFEQLSVKIQENFNITNDWTVMWWQNPSLDNQNYLIIANIDPQELKFCLQLPTNIKLPLNKTYISSFGYAGSKKIGLETIYQQPIPSYLIDNNIFYSDQ